VAVRAQIFLQASAWEQAVAAVKQQVALEWVAQEVLWART
jgi:hypothetical protein